MPEKLENNQSSIINLYNHATVSLKESVFVLLLISQFFSLMGTWTQATAQRWLMLEMTNSTFYVGVMGAVAGLPFLLFSFFGGWLSDKVPRVKVLFGSQSIILVQSFIFGMLVIWQEYLTISVFLTLVFVFTTAMSFEVPARQALMYEIVGRKFISNALGLHSIVFNLAQIIGPAIAGYLLQHKIAEYSFFFKSLTTVFVLLIIIQMGRRLNSTIKQIEVEEKQDDSEKNSKKHYSMKDVIKIANKNPLIRTVLLILLIFSLFVTPYGILIPSLCRDVLMLGAKEYGYISGSVGAGACFAALLLTAFSQHKGDIGDRKAWWMLGIFIYPVSMILVSFSSGFWDTLFYIFLAGMAGIFTANSSISLLQVSVEDAYRGKIMGLFTMCFMGFFPLGSIGLGMIAQEISLRKTFLLCGVFSMLIVLVSLRYMNKELKNEHKGDSHANL